MIKCGKCGSELVKVKIEKRSVHQCPVCSRTLEDWLKFRKAAIALHAAIETYCTEDAYQDYESRRKLWTAFGQFKDLT